MPRRALLVVFSLGVSACVTRRLERQLWLKKNDHCRLLHSLSKMQARNLAQTADNTIADIARMARMSKPSRWTSWWAGSKFRQE